MDSQEPQFQLKPIWGTLQEAKVPSEGNHTQDVDLHFRDQMENGGTQTKASSEDSRLQFRDSMDLPGLQLEGGMEDLALQPRGSLEDLSAQFEECLEELGGLFLGQSRDMDTHIEGCLEDINTQLEECTHELVAQLEEPQEQDNHESDYAARPSDAAALGELGLQFEVCIAQVGVLETRRDQLVAELLELEEPMAREAREQRVELAQAWRQLIQSELQKRSLQEEVLGVRKRLFTTVRECTQSRVTLDMLQRDLKESAIVQEELQAELLRLTEEATQLRLGQQNRLNDLQSQLSAADPSLGTGELSQCREASRAIQHQLQSGMHALEEQYEPRLQALLARRQAGTEATKRSQDEARELRAQLGPLREEVQRLALQRAYLHERLELMQQEREENLRQHREALDALEESKRKLKTELQIQKKKNKEIEKTKSTLEELLGRYRCSTDVQGKAEAAIKAET